MYTCICLGMPGCSLTVFPTVSRASCCFSPGGNYAFLKCSLFYVSLMKYSQTARGTSSCVESLHFSLAFLKMHKSQVGSYTNKTKNREQRAKNEVH